MDIADAHNRLVSIALYVCAIHTRLSDCLQGENPVTEAVHVTADRIRRLEVQGARNVAIAAIEALQCLAEKTRARTRQGFLKELIEAKDILFSSRGTEPLMRNAVRLIISQVEHGDKKSVKKCPPWYLWLRVNS